MIVFYREEHSSIFLNIRRLHNIVSTHQVVLDVVLLKGAEKTTTPQACILKLLPEGQGAQPGLGEGLAHQPWAPLPVPRRLHRSLELIRGKAAAAHVAEALDALIDQGGRGLPVRHRHAAAEQHLKLLGERVIELGRAAELVLAGDLPGLPDGADNLRHLPGKEGVLFGTRSGWRGTGPASTGANAVLSPSAHGVFHQPLGASQWESGTRRGKWATYTETRRGKVFTKHLFHAGATLEDSRAQHPASLSKELTATQPHVASQTQAGPPTPKPKVFSGKLPPKHYAVILISWQCVLAVHQVFQNK